jgi:anti-anti-sigma factor
MSATFENPASHDVAAPTRVRIQGEMTVYRALELKQALLVALADAHTLEIDLSAVGEIDSAGVQLLLLAHRQAEASGKAMRLAAMSETVAETLEILGLGSHFPSAQPAAATSISGVCA